MRGKGSSQTRSCELSRPYSYALSHGKSRPTDRVPSDMQEPRPISCVRHYKRHSFAFIYAGMGFPQYSPVLCLIHGLGVRVGVTRPRPDHPAPGSESEQIRLLVSILVQGTCTQAYSYLLF